MPAEKDSFCFYDKNQERQSSQSCANSKICTSCLGCESSQATHEIKTDKTPEDCCQHEKWLPSISFSGCGLHVFFQLGAAKCFLDNNVRTKRVCATSAGVASALFYLLDMRPYLDLEKLLKLVPSGAQHEGTSFLSRLWQNKAEYGKNKKYGLQLARQQMIDYLSCVINEHYPNAYKQVSGKLEVILMRFPNCCMETCSEWYSNNDLIQCLCACTDIPIVDAKINPTKWRNKKYYDGGILCSHPIVDARTVCVTTSSFYQPWTKAYRLKKKWYGEICYPLSSGSLHVMKRNFYRDLWHMGCKISTRYIQTNFLCSKT